MKSDCRFCNIITRKTNDQIIWEDKSNMAFLSCFPNTKGLTVVVTKKHYSSYAFDLPNEVVSGLVLAAKKVAKLLDDRLEDVGRTGLILEGFGVNHLHVKLFPMHGTKIAGWKPIRSNVDKYFEKYEGYISSHDSKRASDENLAKLAEKIRQNSPRKSKGVP